MRQRYDFGYFLSEGFHSIFTHGFMSFAAVCMIVCCLLIMGSFTLVAVNAENMFSDLDIVFYDDEIVAESELIIPHIDMQNRLFVLEPLYMLCPGKVHPVLHKTVAQLRQELISKTQNKWSNE